MTDFDQSTNLLLFILKNKARKRPNFIFQWKKIKCQKKLLTNSSTNWRSCKHCLHRCCSRRWASSRTDKKVRSVGCRNKIYDFYLRKSYLCAYIFQKGKKYFFFMAKLAQKCVVCEKMPVFFRTFINSIAV